MSKNREIFFLETYTTGKAGLYIRTPEDRRQNTAGHCLTPEAKDHLNPASVTPALLRMLAVAYYAGYETAMQDGVDAVIGLMRGNSAPRKPAPKISEQIDYRAKK